MRDVSGMRDTSLIFCSSNDMQEDASAVSENNEDIFPDNQPTNEEVVAVDEGAGVGVLQSPPDDITETETDKFTVVQPRRAWKKRSTQGESEAMNDDPDLQAARAKQVRLNKLCMPRSSKYSTSSASAGNQVEIADADVNVFDDI